MTRLRANVTPPRQRPRVYICIHLVDGSYNFIGLNAHRRFPKRSWRIVCNDRASTPSLGRLASLIVPYLHRGHICFVKDKRRNGITTNGINFTFSFPPFSIRLLLLIHSGSTIIFFFPPKERGSFFPSSLEKKERFSSVRLQEHIVQNVERHVCRGQMNGRFRISCCIEHREGWRTPPRRTTRSVERGWYKENNI